MRVRPDENEKPARVETRRAFDLGRKLFDISGALLAITFSGESLFSAAFFAWLQVKRVPLDFLYDVFLLNLPLETA
jgi:hypothetical protein